MTLTETAYWAGLALGVVLGLVIPAMWRMLRQAIDDGWKSYFCPCYACRNTCDCEVCENEHSENEWQRYLDEKHFGTSDWKPTRIGHHG